MAEAITKRGHDRRTPRGPKSSLPRGGHGDVHRSIFQVEAACTTCNDIDFGTCFLLDKFYRLPGGGEFVIFVTAAHVVYCREAAQHASRYRLVDIGLGGIKGSLPERTLLDKRDLWVGTCNDYGWVAVCPEYVNGCNIRPPVNDRVLFPYDYALIAVRKDKIPESLRETELPRHGLLDLVQEEQHNFAAEAFLCGYPGEVSDTEVLGTMYWMDEAASKPVIKEQLSTDRCALRQVESSSSSVFSMPQCHVPDATGPDGKGTVDQDTDKQLVKESLYRHYIDSSSGQSGAPLYEKTTDDYDEEVYRAVGVHVGFWEMGAQYSCNVAVKLRPAVVEEMISWVEAHKGRAKEAYQPSPSASGFRIKKYGKTVLFTPRASIPRVETLGPDKGEGGTLYSKVEDQEKFARGLEAHMNDNQRKNLAREVVRKYQINLLNRYQVQIRSFARDPSNGITGYPPDETNLHAIFEWANKESNADGKLMLEEIKEHLIKVAPGSKHHFEHTLREVGILEYDS